MESNREFLVACLCAQWCDTCVAYKPGFHALAERFPRAEFRWVDIEDDAEAVEVGVVRMQRPAPLEAWCRARGIGEALVGGFYVRPDGAPLGELRTRVGRQDPAR